MALELAKTAENKIFDFFEREDALARLGRLHSHTLGVAGDVLKAPKPQEVTHNVLDLAVQKVVEKLSWKLMTEAHATPTSVGVPALLDLCIAGVTSNFLINSTPYKVLEDLMEGQTISTCEMVWELLESRKDKLTTGRTTKASLCLLRMCNALLRRLSKTHNSVFCGKILVFLSFTFALSERSAVNLTGKANVTNIDNDPSADVGPIDYNLYRTFWDLQSFFREHQMATHSAENWEKFFTELNVVLAAFEGNAFSPDDLERSRDLSGGGPIHSADVIMHEDSSTNPAEQGSQEHFFQPKYLTNSRLFRLQLRDPILRECMLTQFLILFNDLARAKPPAGSTTPKAKFADLTERVVALLKQTPSDGEGFSEMVSYVLERERNWVKWKQEKCREYEKYPSAADKEGSAPKPVVKRARRQLTSPLLEQILSESSKPSQILEKIKGKERASEVPLSAYTERFKEAWDPENGIEEEYWPDKDEMVCWRTMRAAMKGSVDHLDWAVKGTGALVKAVLGMETTDANKDTTDAAASTPRQSSSSGDAEVVKKEQESGREATKDSSGIKRKRSDSRGEA
ncbi:hypothetical protein PHYSODRAFT_540491 [Phytophthora sojae]|uniref:THO complex subunit 1 n=1 Tax=Phytophthora sojae (strain P6497) TaxID=1094619 RepID=G4Z1M1_PHYSP|nr:hypothetical protein PHYSODRAFT_540491 [Phytophthora sojae]EGZ25932.1 hypothetical protein PHYSODRAFT_540491 [Phytophthora sojae]|eukprot:XP_009521220.1 hypothetical protein PHYSODRAFT_540491 [Phytophthora sojae]